MEKVNCNIVEKGSCLSEIDEKELINLYYRIFNETYPNLKKDFDRSVDTVKGWLTNRPIVYFVLCKDTLIGFMILGRNDLDQLYIDKPFQKQGIGSKLIKIAQKTYSQLSLFTFQENDNAINFYKKHGFEIQKYGIAPDEKVPDVFMVWKG